MTITFQSEPTFQRAPRGNFELRTALVVSHTSGLRWSVPVGFTTDGASIPPLMWLVVGHPYSPSSLRASILHDWMCRNPDAHQMPSCDVHEVFHEALLADGCAAVRSWLMWMAVRLFGPSF